MRIPVEVIEGNPWATYLRQSRLQSQVKRSHYRGTWPMRQAVFAKWLSGIVGFNISPMTYIFWETGRTIPTIEKQTKIREALAGNPIPRDE